MLDHCGWGNLGDAAIQTSVLQNLARHVGDADVVGLTLNPEDTEQRHGIESYPIRKEFYEYVRWRERDSASEVDAGDTGHGRQTGSGVRAILKRALRRVPFVVDIVRYIRRSAVDPVRQVIQEVSFLRSSLRIVRALDVLVLSGGGQISEAWGGPWAHPYTLFKWALLAKVAGTKLIVLSVGASPLASRLSRFFVRRTLEMADYVSLRDVDSRRRMQEIGVTRPMEIAPDLAYALDLPPGADAPPETQGPIAVIPMAYSHPDQWPDADVEVYSRYLDEMFNIVSRLSRRGRAVHLLTTTVSFDNVVIDELRERMEREGVRQGSPLVEYRDVETVEELMQELSDVRAVVASRFHATLLSTLLRKPVVAVSYDPKVDALMDDLGLGSFCFGADDFSGEDIVRALETVLSEEVRLRKRLLEKTREYRRELDRQFASVLALREESGWYRRPIGAESGAASE